jgi:hypothetical protein
MRERELLKALSNPDNAISTNEPPGRAFFFHDKEIGECSSILSTLVRSSLSRAPNGNRNALPLPDVDLPMIF